VVPLLFRQEISAGQAYIDEALQDSDTCVLTGAPLMPGIAGGVGALVAVAANPRAVSAWSVYVFLIGPRLVVDAYRMTKLARGLPTVNVEQAAEVVCTLMSQSEGVETSSLLQPGKRFDDLLPTLAYLVFYRWIGVGDGWKRVWLWSQVREALRGL